MSYIRNIIAQIRIGAMTFWINFLVDTLLMAGSTGPETYFRQEEDWLTQINMQPDELDQHHRQKFWNWKCEYAGGSRHSVEAFARRFNLNPDALLYFTRSQILPRDKWERYYGKLERMDRGKGPGTSRCDVETDGCLLFLYELTTCISTERMVEMHLKPSLEPILVASRTASENLARTIIDNNRLGQIAYRERYPLQLHPNNRPRGHRVPYQVSRSRSPRRLWWYQTEICF